VVAQSAGPHGSFADVQDACARRPEADRVLGDSFDYCWGEGIMELFTRGGLREKAGLRKTL